MIPDATLRKAYWYVLLHPKGYWSELDQIDVEVKDHLEKENVIACGYINSCGDLRYKLTSDGEKVAKIQYTSLTLKLFRERNKYAKLSA